MPENRKIITVLISDVNRVIAFEWMIENLKHLFDFRFVLYIRDPENPGSLFHYLKAEKIPCTTVNLRSKKDYPAAFLKTLGYFRKNKTETVHCHLFDACLIGLMAARMAGIKERIHTRHNSTIHHDQFPHMVKYDRLINRLSTRVIAVSEKVEDILVNRENCPKNKITVIHHGFDFDMIDRQVEQQSEKTGAKHHLTRNDKVVGVISRMIDWKGIHELTDAVLEIHRKQPEVIFVFANTIGVLSDTIRKKLSVIPEEKLRWIPFEDNVFALMSYFDIFIHTPIDEYAEAFGQVYIEAMALKIPSVFTPSGIACEIARDRENCLLVPYRDSRKICEATLELLNDPALGKKLGESASGEVREFFPLKKYMEQLRQLYSSTL